MRLVTLPAVALLAVALTACTTAHIYPAPEPASPSPTAAPTDAVSDDPAGTCQVGTPDCDDTASDDQPVAAFDDHLIRRRASDLLATAEADLPDDVRVGRRGDETFMLTEDYVVGRLTVELDRGDEGAWVVSLVHAELASGPETMAAAEALADDGTG